MLTSVKLQSVEVSVSSNENPMNWNPVDPTAQKVQENYHPQVLFIGSDATVKEIV